MDMLVIRCTEKFARELGVRRKDLEDTERSGFLGSWFAHLFRIERRKCLIFTNDETLYSFVVPAFRRAELADLPALFSEHLLRSLEIENLDGYVRSRIENELEPLVVAPTNNRSVVGSMNDLRYMAEVRIEAEGGLDVFDAGRVGRFVNRTPMSALGHGRPLDLFKVKLGLTA